MDDLTTESSLYSQSYLGQLGLFLTCYLWELYNQTLADVQSTGAGTKCLNYLGALGTHKGANSVRFLGKWMAWVMVYASH